MAPKKVLIIEDNPDLLQMIGLAFELEKFQIQKCSNGLGGLNKVNSFNPDVIILDIMMPEMDGNEVLSKIEKQGDSDPLVIIFSNLEWTGKQNPKTIYLKKSNHSPTVLVEKVRQSLEKKPALELCPSRSHKNN